MKTIDLVAGARPNFIKLAPVHRTLGRRPGLELRIVHTGQHYDSGMNDVFFQELEIPPPHVHLEVGSGSHGAQTAKILERYEEHLMREKPDATVVFGDVNSTVACALAAVKLDVPVVHVEAGLRSFDRSMPEEINRVLTDSIGSLLLVTEPSGVRNLKKEGIQDGRVRLVGNVMIDTLVRELEGASGLDVHKRLRLKRKEYALVTMHRPSNVDEPSVLERMLKVLAELGRTLPVVFPVHPRTRDEAENAGLSDLLVPTDGFRCVAPLPYRENLCLMAHAEMVLTDSGGMQEETTFLKVPCLTLRENTERPITVEKGTSRLVGNGPERIRVAFEDVLAGRWPAGEDIPLWDGKASERVAEAICNWLGSW